MRRALFLYKLWLRSSGRRLRHDLGRELTVFVASLVLFATFFYIFNDFLNVQIAALSPVMRERFAAVASTVVLTTAVLAAAVLVHRTRTARRGFGTVAAYLGEGSGALRVLGLLQAATVFAVTHGAAWYLVERWLSRWHGVEAACLAAALIGASAALLWILGRWPKASALSREADAVASSAAPLADGHTPIAASHARGRTPAAASDASGRLPTAASHAHGSAVTASPHAHGSAVTASPHAHGSAVTASPHAHGSAVTASPLGDGRLPATVAPVAATLGSPVLALVAWRLRALLGRSRLSSLCLGLAAATQVFIILAAWRQTPPFVAAAAGLASGYLAAVALCALLSEDLRQIWLERGGGVSHHQFIQAYKILSWLTAATVAVLGAVLYLGTTAATGTLTTGAALDAAKLAATAAVPCLVTPYLFFQIDGRRLAITAVTVLIAGLFIGTAVLANWLGLALIPILAAFAGQAQAGRFYRA